jgi:two-component system chemotaxis response regulator CheY
MNTKSLGWSSLSKEEELGMKQILVVDDSSTMRRMVMASLRDLKNVNFGQASSGLEAIEHLAIGKVDLMILDLNMPDINGLEVVQFVRQHKTYSELPIIVLTTRGDDCMREAIISAGASFYLTKPFQPNILTAHVNQLLN